MVQTLWDSITEFLAGGDKRTEALQEGIRENVTPFVPPNLREPLGLLAEVNPVQDIYRAGGNMRGGNYVDAGIDTAIAAAPVVGGVLGRVGAKQLADTGGDAARAAMDTLLGGAPGRSASAVDAGRNFVADEAGSVGRAAQPLPTPRNDAEAMARDILDMRAAGRAGDVTDEMMAQADPQYMFANTPLPMDEASRMARAREMGFEGDWYHGTDIDFKSASADMGQGERSQTGFYSSSSPDVASTYTSSDGGRTLPIMTRDQFGGPIIDVQGGAWSDIGPDAPTYHRSVGDEDAAFYYGRLFDDLAHEGQGLSTNAVARDARFEGDSNVQFLNLVDRGAGDPYNLESYKPSNVRADFYPHNIRSRFARFDPEFSHLRNLSAGVAGGGLLATQDTEQQREEEIRQYLGGLL